MNKHFFTVLLLFVASLPLSAQSVEERLAKLEQEVRALKEENAELRKQVGLAVATPAPAVAAKETPKAAETVVHPAGKETDLVLGGMIQAQAESGDRLDSRFTDDNDRFYVRRLRLSADARWAEHYDFRMETDFTGALGNTSGYRAQLTDAYVTWNKYPAARVRFGQMKTPFSFEQLTGDARQIAPERTLGGDRIPLGRQIGVQVLGDVLDKRVNYAIGAFNGNGTNLNFNDDEGVLVAGRLGTTLWNGTIDGGKATWTAAANAFTSEDRNVTVVPELQFTGNTFAGQRNGYGIDTQFIGGRTEIWAEALKAKFDPTTGPEKEMETWSVLGGWMFTKKLQGVLRYDTFDAPTGDENTWTGGANYLVKGNDLKLQFFYLRTDDGDARVIARVQAVF